MTAPFRCVMLKEKKPSLVHIDTAEKKIGRIHPGMLMYGKVSQENYVELTAASAIPNKEIKSPQILRY